jgi:hypothetical protein
MIKGNSRNPKQAEDTGKYKVAKREAQWTGTPDRGDGHWKAKKERKKIFELHAK